jgi:endonuclease VIII
MEGPQTHALADTLAEKILGNPVGQIHVPANRWQANVLLHNCVGQVIQRTRAHGRWLFLDFSHGVTWASELLAKSTWTLREAAEPDRVLPGLPMLSLELRTGVKATLTGRPVFLILPTEILLNHADLKTLGPDPLVSPDYPVEFPQRLRRAAGRTVAAALLDQDIVAGLGNPLKCEILFAARLAPATRVGDLLASQIDNLAQLTAKIYRDATAAARRNENFDYAVYDRAGDPCPRCGNDISLDRSAGDHQTWFCPVCQKPPENPTLFTP